MEEKKQEGFSAEGRRLRPRRPRISKVSDSGNYSKSQDYNSENSEYSSERRSYDRGSSRAYNSNSYGRSRYNSNRSQDRSYSSDRGSYNREGGYRSDNQGFRSERSSDRRQYNSRGGYNNDKYSSDRRGAYNREGYNNSERRYNTDNRSNDRRSYRDGNNSNSGYERRSFNGDRRNNGYGRRDNNRYDSYNKDRRNNFSKERNDNGINKMIERRPILSNMAFSDNDYVKSPIKQEVRLNKYIANSGVCSRREADQFIQAGVVSVNDVIVTELGTKINISTDEVKFNGERLKGEEKVYLVMNKPKGFVTTSSDPHAQKTVMDLLKSCQYRVFPVGRLDKNTTGVLMFTNDGAIAESLTHPSYDKKKIYQVVLDKALSDEDFNKIKEGILLGDGEIKPDDLEFVDADDHRKLGIEIHSGKNRIVRRIFESLGYDVKGLDRVYFAGLTKKGLKKGEWRYLTASEANILKMGSYA